MHVHCLCIRSVNLLLTLLVLYSAFSQEHLPVRGARFGLHMTSGRRQIGWA